MKADGILARLAMQDGSGDFREGFARRDLTNRNVRRRLFVDDEGNERPERGLDENKTNELFEEFRNNLQKAKERWNFDFETETPLPGNYLWVKLDQAGNDVPNCVPDARVTNRVEECKSANKITNGPASD